jgi:hypothetical protein
MGYPIFKIIAVTRMQILLCIVRGLVYRSTQYASLNQSEESTRAVAGRVQILSK